MSETRYVIELAKSARAKCKKCKEPIQAEDMRIGAKSHNGEFEMVSWVHVGCFRLPRKYVQGSTKMSVEDFVKDVLEDESGQNILSSRMDEIIEQIEESSETAGRKKGGKKSDDADSVSPIADLKAAYEKGQKELAEGKEPSSKKAKSDLGARLDAYARFKDAKNSELHDILKYNRQVVKGTKDFMLAKVVDGCVYGRLSRCHMCGGSLKMKEDGKTIECGGGFDENTQRRLPCAFTCPAADAPRWKPWYETEPNEEEAEAMDRLIEEYREAGGLPGGSGVESEEDVQELIKAVAKIKWDLTNKASIQTSVDGLADVLVKGKGFKKLDLPSDLKQAKQKLGEVVLVNKDKTIEELVPILVQEFGFAEAKAAKAEKKQAAMEGNMACPANAPIVAVLQELADLYFKEGNRNAGSTYVKAVAAIRDLSYEITENNAKGLGKGKTKINNVGKGTADKIYEFLSTGKIEKLEEKRGDAA